ncbi:hypothetical protein TMatcc_007708 [Talaromyces marneffei ATCC 18224]|uniref:Uncharacterized protein n=1 Tax=Talaromyces marneffei (strain ATCC 18224 / CBS 334.59 / QM 7333) TaxID=441960 RepID=B6QGL9_TALMQ|nr:uncharacterized protein EYB26_004643 [Talaromyces marneffei]EEA24604.1 conserved hypothetical protein [Talaromyces marneffei ATCC 18224]KAE8552894.1 hypothetical protein EYB25_004273 [Talaromyces marneffei]QGA16973.1 hypothetical protein EYB26_004643 [Talaromyces marneffei]
MAYPSDEKHNVEAATFEFTYRNRRQHRRTKLLIALLGGTIAFYSLLGAILICFYSDATLLALITNPRFNHRLNHLRNQWISTKSNIEKPRGVNVVAVVEYGNWERSSILDCYLRRNLVEYGGLLDEVIFIPGTSDRRHLEWLYETVNKSESYSIHQSLPAVDAKNVYIKIDGDVVYIEDNVIPAIVNTKLKHPDTSLISANVIHQPAVAEFHRRPGVVLPQSLDNESSSQDSKTSSERSWNPFWPDWRNMLKSWFASKMHCPSHSTLSKSTNATEKHAWTFQAQQHNSFLHHLERGELQTYKFPLWKNPPGEISGAFIILPNNNNNNDTTNSSQKNVLIDGKGVVSHYDDTAGLEGLDATDILGRYRKYAEEHICFAD